MSFQRKWSVQDSRFWRQRRYSFSDVCQITCSYCCHKGGWCLSTLPQAEAQSMLDVKLLRYLLGTLPMSSTLAWRSRFADTKAVQHARGPHPAMQEVSEGFRALAQTTMCLYEHTQSKTTSPWFVLHWISQPLHSHVDHFSLLQDPRWTTDCLHGYHNIKPCFRSPEANRIYLVL